MIYALFQIPIFERLELDTSDVFVQLYLTLCLTLFSAGVHSKQTTSVQLSTIGMIYLHFVVDQR